MTYKDLGGRPLVMPRSAVFTLSPTVRMTPAFKQQIDDACKASKMEFSTFMRNAAMAALANLYPDEQEPDEEEGGEEEEEEEEERCLWHGADLS
jgi:hypothetical protein